MMRRHLHAILALIGLAVASPATAGDAPIETSVVEHADHTRSLHHETVVDAPVARVWQAFSTVEGWKSWGITFAKLDFRTGGTIETAYADGAGEGDPNNIIHRILAVIPERLLVTRVERLPENGPVAPALIEPLWGVYEIEPIDEKRTRLRISGHGYGQGEDYDRLIAFFEAGDAISINMMRSAIEAAE